MKFFNEYVVPGFYTLEKLIPQFLRVSKGFIAAPGARITATDQSMFSKCKKLHVEKCDVGESVFVGANAVILPGVRLGKGVIVGAGAIVYEDVPDYAIVVGNPAKVIGNVQSYIKRLKERDVLYSIPDSFLIEAQKSGVPSMESIIELRNSVNNEYRQKHDKK